MTKSRDNKQAIRAYMRTHGVNYTTAKRALAAQATTRAARTAELLTGAVHIPHTDGERPATDLTAPAPGQFCERHWSWLCQAGQGKCQTPADATDLAAPTTDPVILDVARARTADLFTLPHIHDLDGRCAKNRHGNFCTPPTETTLADAPPPSSPRVAIGVDPDPNYVHSVVNLLHDLNTPPLTGGLGTGEPVTPSNSDRLRTAAHATTQETQQNVIPEGATVRRWQQTGLDPDTGKRVPTVITEIRHPADATGHIHMTTHTDFNARLDSNGHLDRAQRVLDGPVPAPSRRTDLKAALRTGDHDILNAHRRAHAPGPDPSDIQAALEVLASLELALREHTSDPETPVTHEMLRHAILAASTHGETWGGGHGYPTAADVCRSYLLGTKVTTGPETPDLDGQYPVAPEDLAAILEDLADDDMTLDEACEGSAVTADDLAEELLILANTLDGTLPTTTSTKTATTSLRTDDDHHYLVVHQPTTPHRRGRFTIDCTTPTTGRGTCEGWEECPDCSLLDADTYDHLLDSGAGTIHGIEHIMLNNGPATATGKCALIAFPEAWEESDAILNLPPGRYAIHHHWEDEYCTLTLRTR